MARSAWGNRGQTPFLVPYPEVVIIKEHKKRGLSPISLELVMRAVTERFVAAVFAAAQVDFGGFRNFKLHRCKRCILVRPVTERLLP